MNLEGIDWDQGGVVVRKSTFSSERGNELRISRDIYRYRSLALSKVQKAKVKPMNHEHN